MKPFDLERALAGDPVVTRKGEEVQQIVHLTSIIGDCPVLAVINGRLCTFTIDGRYFRNELDSDMDLFMAPKKRTVWVNLYPNKLCGAFWHYDVSQANKSAEDNRIGGKAYPVEIEE